MSEFKLPGNRRFSTAQSSARISRLGYHARYLWRMVRRNYKKFNSINWSEGNVYKYNNVLVNGFWDIWIFIISLSCFHGKHSKKCRNVAKQSKLKPFSAIVNERKQIFPVNLLLLQILPILYCSLFNTSSKILNTSVFSILSAKMCSIIPSILHMNVTHVTTS